MLKNIIILIAFVAIGIFGYTTLQSNTRLQSKIEINPQQKLQEEIENTTDDIFQEKATIEETAVFVPYWADFSTPSSRNYNIYYYFGVSVNKDGVDTEDVGYANMQDFLQFAAETPDTETWLTVRMLDAETNTAILEDPDSWNKIAESIAETATQNGFEGVMVDLEVGLASFHINPASITGFMEVVKKENDKRALDTGMTIYGDTFYRKRPYNLKNLGNTVDRVVIMAYDFHKSFGLAGPNFPLNGRENYGYDFTTMISDVKSLVASDKISAAFGMYGYEWIVDEQERPLKAASAVPLGTIMKTYFPSCAEKDCRIVRDTQAGEQSIRFKDEQGREHVIWFEDESSVEAKIKVLENNGISKIGYWAYGYW